MQELGTKQLGLLLLVLLVLAAVIALFSTWTSSTGTQNSPATTASQLPPQTVPSAQALQELQQNPTFQYLVSYTDQGFEPATLTVSKGDVVRFTNNSSGQLWVASVGNGSEQIYPGSSNCGGSSFDSCGPLQSGEFWQFKFTQSGTYDFENKLDPSQSGAITITVQ